MILQTISVLKNKSIILILLLLTQIEVKQTEYITCINETLFFLNVNIINKKILADI